MKDIAFATQSSVPILKNCNVQYMLNGRKSIKQVPLLRTIQHSTNHNVKKETSV